MMRRSSDGWASKSNESSVFRRREMSELRTDTYAEFLTSNKFIRQQMVKEFER
jgi:hypothetical protein